MTFKEVEKTAVRLCLKKRLPFALYFLPDEDVARFVASKSVRRYEGDDASGFFVNLFRNAFGTPIFIPNEYSVNEVVALCSDNSVYSEPDITPNTCSTDKKEYITKVRFVIDKLGHDGGKAVLSRVICGSAEGIDWVRLSEKYFEAFRSTFRYIYYTPLTGAWIGASPEILLRRQFNSNVVETMSLAGTKSVDSGDWDLKNVEEHNYVTDFIISKLTSLGLTPQIGASENVRFGKIEHLCHRIRAEYMGDLIAIANHLSPTPALAGKPLEKALEHIRYVETHPRYCYGGYVGCRNEMGEYIYVNLRCVHFCDKSYCIYAGGGVTGRSIPESEWDETEAKSEFLRNLLA